MSKNMYALTNPQKSIWLTEQFYKGTSIENITGSVIISEKVDFDALKKAINLAVKNNDNFRLKFTVKDGIVMQYVDTFTEFDIELISVETDEDVKSIERKMCDTPFNTLDNFLFDFKLFKFPDGHGGAIINAHHLIFDAWTTGIICNQIMGNYESLINNQEISNEQPSYVDYIHSENEYLNSEKFNKDKAFWNKIFENVPEVATIPSLKQETKEISCSAKRKLFSIQKKTIDLINDFCKTRKASTFNFFMGVFSIYLSRVSGLDHFVIGTPILNRGNFKEKQTGGMFISTIPFKFSINNDSLFGEFLSNISSDFLKAFRHQKYPYQLLLEDLRSKDNSVPNLYNILISYQNSKTSNDNSKIPYTTRWIENNNISDDIDIHLFDVNDTGNIDIAYDYLVSKYTADDICSIHARILHIINQILENNEIKLSEIEIVTPDEKRKILYDFNDTKADYPKDKTITQLFEEQVEKTPDNVAVVFENEQLTYRELNERANSLANYLRNKGIGRNDIVGIMVNRSLEMIVSILAVLKSGACYIPIDPEYPQDRIGYMLNNSNAKMLLTFEKLNSKVNFDNKLFVELKNELYDSHKANLKNINEPNDLSYIIYTSGSTGMPKGVMLAHKSLSNLANYCNHYIEYLKNNKYRTIVSITTVSFDIFVFETLISLQRGLKLVIANEEEQTIPRLLSKLIEKNNVEIIQTTPSRMQLLVNNIKDILNLSKLKFITLAGEQLPISLVNDLKKIGSPVIYNGYGPSETTVFSTLTDVTNHNTITIGRPLDNTQIYILNPNLNICPIEVPGEIYIAGDGVGHGYINNEELTKKSYLPNIFSKENKILYKTGDLGYYRPDGEIICLGRCDNQVKIRGLRIELEEIENEILKFDNIRNCVVVKKVSDNGHEFLCAYFTAINDISIDNIRNSLYKNLPKYMVPQYFLKLEELPYTPNGKIDRKKLPIPNFESRSKEIVLPRNNTDELLIKLLKELLNIENISIEDSFFELGGDSLTAINLCTKIYSEFNVQIFVKDIIENPVIKELSDLLSKKENANNSISIQKVEPASSYPVSSAQKNIYIASQMAGENSLLYNIPGGVIFNKLPDIKKLEKCFNELILRHESFRTYFEVEDENIVQKIIKDVKFKIELDETILPFEELNNSFKNFVKPFDLSKAPLLRAKLVKLTDGKCALFVDMHHIISDGTSLTIFIQELCKLYNNVELEQIDFTYKDFSYLEYISLSSGKYKESEQFWVNQFKNELPVLNMPTNYARPAVKSYEGAKVYSNLNPETTEKINHISKELGVTPYMLLLSVYYILLSKYTSQEDIVVGSPIVGRNFSELYNIIGMFVNTLPVRARINSSSSFKEFLNEVKNICLENYKHQDYPLNELISRLNIQRDTSRAPLFDTVFTYQNKWLSNIDFEGIDSNFYMPDTKISKFDLSLEIIPDDNGLSISFEYATKLFNKDFIQNFSNHYLNIINIILENTDIKIANICMLSDEEKNLILNEFNSLKVDYPKDTTIIHLFEEQVEKNPDNIAVVLEDEKLTYRELNAKANSLAHFLKQSGIGKNDIVPVFMNRSLDLIISMMGIIKVGAAYLPISSEMPKERIDYILTNCKAKIVFTKYSQNLIDNDSIKILDIEQFDYSKFSTKNLEIEIKPTDLLYVIYTSGSTGNPKGVKICHKNLVNFVNSFNIIYSDISSNDRLLASTNISFDVSIFEFFITLLNGATLYLYNEPNITDIFKYCKTIIRNKITFLYIPPNILEDVYNILSTYSNIQINKLLLGVEPIKSSTIKKYYNLNPNMKIVNAYGPTESTICSTAIILDNNLLKEYKIIPIGKPLHNLQIFILDKNLQPVPLDVPGEIYISGDNVSKGYLNNKDLTDKSFVSIPSLNCPLAYKTGDLAKWNKDGLISFIGRNDYQVKINGHRIELGELESCIYLYPNIDKALVLIDKNNKLICYFSSSKQININDLKAFMQRKLPLYFIPNFFVQVENFKLTSNGKIDRKALAKIKIDTQSTYEEPKTEYQKNLVKAFETVLGLNKIGITDNFFELGGDSLLAIKLQIEAFNMGLDLSYKDIFKYPTVKELSENVSSAKTKKSNSHDEYDYTQINKLLENNVFNNKSKLVKNKFKNVLLTGATGFLGSHILDALLKNTKCNVYCLIRPKDNNDPQIRLLNTLQFYFGNKYDKQIFNRIIVVEGDITENQLGLNDLYYEELGNTIDIVINSAANVKHYGNIDTFNQTNIEGVKNIISFCSDYKSKLYHLSTLSVSGNIFETDSYKVAELSSEITFNEQSLYIGQDLSNVYIYTKFIAERLILENILNGTVAAKIIRLGNITNRYSDGIFQINLSENAFLNRINSFLNIGCIPDYLADRYMEFSPVDLCAECIVKLICYNSNASIYHVYNNNHITFRKLLSILSSLKIDIKIVDKDTFNKKIKSLLKDDGSKNILSGIINDFDENKNLVYNTNIKLQNNFTNKILRNLLFKWPKINEKYLKKYVIYLKSIGYIK